MKSNCPGHPKFIHLVSLLGKRRFEVIGHLELLWKFTAEYAPEGNIGRWSDEAIAVAAEWPDDPAAFIRGLVGAGLLDESPDYRLVVHDWHEHCPEYIKKRLHRSKKAFASILGGTCPDNGGQRRTTADDKKICLPAADNGGIRTPTEPHRTQPIPNPTEPQPSHEADAGGQDQDRKPPDVSTEPNDEPPGSPPGQAAREPDTPGSPDLPGETQPEPCDPPEPIVAGGTDRRQGKRPDVIEGGVEFLHGTYTPVTESAGLPYINPETGKPWVLPKPVGRLKQRQASMAQVVYDWKQRACEKLIHLLRVPVPSRREENPDVLGQFQRDVKYLYGLMDRVLGPFDEDNGFANGLKFCDFEKMLFGLAETIAGRKGVNKPLAVFRAEAERRWPENPAGKKEVA